MTTDCAAGSEAYTVHPLYILEARYRPTRTRHPRSREAARSAQLESPVNFYGIART